MKLLFIPAKTKVKPNLKKVIDISKALPQEIAIAYSVQFKDIASDLKVELSKNHNVTAMVQVLGCSQPKIPPETQAILLVGSGKFHAVSLQFETGIQVYVLTKNTLEKIDANDVKKLEQRRKAAYMRFLNEGKVGVIISTKPGQERKRRAFDLKKKIKNKKIYFFINNEINTREFENFGINSWINTACPRLNFDYPILNLTQVEEALKEE